MMNTAVADNGLLRCVPLTVKDNVHSPALSALSASTELQLPGAPEAPEAPETLCWREGVQYRDTRVAILSAAREHSVSLLVLSRHLGVKWSHFQEWAAYVGQDVLSLFTEHRWHDELVSDEPQFIKLRRHGLSVGDFFDAL